MTKHWSGDAKTAFGFPVIWALGAGQARVAVTMMISALVFPVCVIAMPRRKLRGA